MRIFGRWKSWELHRDEWHIIERRNPTYHYGQFAYTHSECRGSDKVYHLELQSMARIRTIHRFHAGADLFRVSYDDADTYTLKSTFANQRCLTGVMAWALDLDDSSTQASSFNLISNQLSANDKSLLPGNAMVKKAAVQIQRDVPGLFFWTPCWLNAGAQCPAGTQPLAQGQGKVRTFSRIHPQGVYLYSFDDTFLPLCILECDCAESAINLPLSSSTY